MFLSRVKAFSRLSAVRLTLSLLVVFATITALGWVSTFWLVQREMYRMADARLAAKAVSVVDSLESGNDLPLPGFGQQIFVSTAGGSFGALPFPVPDRPDGAYFHDGRGPEFRYLIHTTSNGEKIVISENADRLDELLDTLSGGMQISLAGILLAGLLGGLLLAVRSQRRLDLINDGLAKVAAGQLETRIALPGREDDLSALAARINATTERLQQSMEQMRVQSSNIAHDLRTPLARLRAGIETSLIELTERNRPVDAETLGSALEQIDRIVGTFNALLRLARIESGAGRVALSTVDLGALVHQISETFEPVVVDAGQNLHLDVDNAAQIMGDRDLLVQLVANLIQNALRYGSDGQQITLSVHGTSLSVRDEGPGIPLAERQKVLQPLYQLEQTRQSDGFGLGLSMVAAISELHGAELSLSEGPRGLGLVVTIQFPRITKL